MKHATLDHVTTIVKLTLVRVLIRIVQAMDQALDILMIMQVVGGVALMVIIIMGLAYQVIYLI